MMEIWTYKRLEHHICLCVFNKGLSGERINTESHKDLSEDAGQSNARILYRRTKAISQNQFRLVLRWAGWERNLNTDN